LKRDGAWGHNAAACVFALVLPRGQTVAFFGRAWRVRWASLWRDVQYQTGSIANLYINPGQVCL
jgi:hypothetical protein